MPIPSAETIKWLALLTAGLTLTTFGTTFPNRFSQQLRPRAHNSVWLFNECLAHSHLALFNYFLALAITAPPSAHPVARLLLVPITVISSYSYITGVGAVAELDQTLGRTHACAGPACRTKMGTGAILRVSARNIVAALTLLAAAVYYALIAGG